MNGKPTVADGSVTAFLACLKSRDGHVHRVG
jgi:hypothetical protein